MSRRNHNRVDLPASKLSRRRQTRRSHAILEALEVRRLLSGYVGQTFTLTNQGSGTADGTYLQDIINGTTLLSNSQVSNHTLTLGDTLILPDTYDYDMGTGELKLPNLGAAVVAVESGGAVTSLSLTFAPAGGYIAAPTVVIFGGGGSGATGSVTYNSTTGTVTGISLTSGGSGYTSAPQVAIVGGAETLTIESSGYNAGDLGSGRFNPATDVLYDAQITGSGVDSIVLTEDPTMEDASGHLGAAQNYAFDGIEVCPDAATDGFQSALVFIGDDTAAQDYDPLVANNFTFNQDYIHGGAPGEPSDDLNTAALETTVAKGLILDANYVTVENSQISDIHSASNNGGGVETHAIGAANLMGNFTINNNYLEATGESILFGGAENYLPSPAQANNIIITNNYLTKNPAWNPALPQYAGVPMEVKNDIELKTGTNVTISHNIIENVWVGADQRGQAINLSNLDTDKMDPWYNDANITITDNVFRNVGRIIVISAGLGDTIYPPSQGDAGYTGLTNNIVIENNLAYDIGGWQWAYDSANDAITMDSSTGGPMYNITIENNTFIGTDGIIYLEGPNGLTTPVVDNLVCENNVLDESEYGIASSAADTDIGTLNSVEFAALTITNPGSGYTTAPTVTISGGGGSGATATAYVWPATEGGLICPFAGQLMYIQITNYGSGYTANPTVSFFGGGGSGGAASAIAESDDQIHGYTLTNNAIIGASQSNYPPTNATTINYFPATENAVQMLDPAGDEYGILSTSPYYSDGTGGSTPGVNMASLAAPGNSTGWVPTDSVSSLQNYYKFNEGSGSTAHDNGLGAHENGTLNGTYTWNTTGPEGGGITFSGGNTGNVSVANFTADSGFTFAAWIKPTNFSATQYIASTNNSSSVSAFSLSINTSGQLVAAGTTGSVTAGSLTAGQWALVSVTYSSGTLTLYVNGADVGSTTSVTTTTGTTTLYIGGNKGSVSSFNGTLDEVRYYSTSLAQTLSVIGDTNLGLAGGGGYNNTTNGTAVSFNGGGGSGAVATAYAENTDGVITSIIMTNSGSGYTAAPTMSFGSTGTGAADIALMSVTPLSYLYAQYGPQFAVTTAENYSNIVTGKTTKLSTNIVTPDEAYSAAIYDWSVVTWPSGAGVGKPSFNGTTNGSTVTFSGVGYYLFQCVVTNSMGQSATVDYPINVLPVSSTNVVFVNPASIQIAESHGTNVSTKTFNVNGTSIASLGNTVTDQWGNAMPSIGWSWSVSEAEYGTITSGGLYTAPDTAWGEINKCIALTYTTPDGLSHTESTANVTVTDASVPSAPATINLTPGASNSNVIAWTAPPGGGETGYDVYQSTDGTYDGNIIYSSTNLSTLSFTDNATNDPTYAPIVGQTYYYYVNAFNANGGGAPTAELGIVTGAPSAPTNLVATGGFNNSVSLTWTNSAGTNATSVTVLRSPDSNIADANLTFTLSGTATTFVDDAATDPAPNTPVDGTTYYYWVETSNTYTSLPAASLGATPIGPPTGLTATAIASNQISVSWVDTSGGVASFYLQYENANGGTWTTSTITPGNSSYLVTMGLSADTQYNFEVEAYTAAGNSGYSSSVSARTWNTAATPTAYEGFNYSTGSSTNLIGQSGGVGWSGGWATGGENGAAVYEISSGSPSVTPTSAFANSTQASDYLLTTGNSFLSSDSGNGIRTLANAIPNTSGTTVWASAVVEDESSTASGYIALSGSSGDTVNFGFYNSGYFSINVYTTGLSANASTAPVENNTYLVVLEITYGTTNTLNMWIDPDPSLPSGSWGSPQATLSSTATLAPINSVFIHGSAQAFDDANVWDELRVGSTAASVVPTTLPSAPTDLMATTPGSNAIALSWNTSSSSTSLVQGYDVWRSTTSATSGFALYKTVGSSTLSYTDTGVSGGTPYYYEVTAENSTGDSLNSNVVSATTTPNVPTSVTAVASGTATSIAVKWSESSTGSVDYNIQRSTSGTGGWSTVATGLTNTSYTDTTVSAGQTYYYEVDAYYTSSNPSAWSSSANAATMAAYEGFAYTTGNGQKWQGANGGLGWSTAWSLSGTNDTSIVAGLSYTSGSSALTTSGNAAQIVADSTAIRSLSSTVGTAGSTLWISAEMNLHEGNTLGTVLGAEIDLGVYSGSTANDVRLGAPNSNGDIGAAVDIYPYANSVSTSTSIVANTTYFVVYEIQYLTTGDVISIYEDPTLVTQPASASAVLTLPSTQQLKSTTELTLNSNEIYTYSQWDELRLGPTYASVTPDPLITNSNKKSSHSHKSSPFLSGPAATGKSSEILSASKPASANLNYFYAALSGGSWRWANSALDDDNLLTAAPNDINGSWQGLFN